MKKLVLFLLVVVLVGALLPMPASAWNVDEIYEHNQKVRAELEAVVMCDDMREFFTLPIMEFHASARRMADFTRTPVIYTSHSNGFPDEIVAISRSIIQDTFAR